MTEQLPQTSKEIIERLKANGKRITKQRITMIDIIMNNDFHNLKELYFEIEKIDPTIGQATVYRMVTTLEELGAIKRVQGYIRECNLHDED